MAKATVEQQAVGGPAPAERPAGAIPTLRRGHRGPWVSYLQAQLNRLGFEAGEADGEFGPLTEDALRRFQRAFRLRVDGVAGRQVFAVLTDPLAAGSREFLEAMGGEALPDVAYRYGLAPEALALEAGVFHRARLPDGHRLPVRHRLLVGWGDREAARRLPLTARVAGVWQLRLDRWGLAREVIAAGAGLSPEPAGMAPLGVAPGPVVVALLEPAPHGVFLRPGALATQLAELLPRDAGWKALAICGPPGPAVKGMLAGPDSATPSPGLLGRLGARLRRKLPQGSEGWLSLAFPSGLSGRALGWWGHEVGRATVAYHRVILWVPRELAPPALPPGKIAAGRAPTEDGVARPQWPSLQRLRTALAGLTAWRPASSLLLGIDVAPIHIAEKDHAPAHLARLSHSEAVLVAWKLRLTGEPGRVVRTPPAWIRQVGSLVRWQGLAGLVVAGLDGDPRLGPVIARTMVPLAPAALPPPTPAVTLNGSRHKS